MPALKREVAAHLRALRLREARVCGVERKVVRGEHGLEAGVGQVDLEAACGTAANLGVLEFNVDSAKKMWRAARKRGPCCYH